jgi:ribonuclease BN (tRNA processing enzyme)
MKAGVQRLVLTHLVPWTPREETQAEAEAVYDGDLVLAEQGMVLEV